MNIFQSEELLLADRAVNPPSVSSKVFLFCHCFCDVNPVLQEPGCRRQKIGFSNKSVLNIVVSSQIAQESSPFRFNTHVLSHGMSTCHPAHDCANGLCTKPCTEQLLLGQELVITRRCEKESICRNCFVTEEGWHIFSFEVLHREPFAKQISLFNTKRRALSPLFSSRCRQLALSAPRAIK